MLKKIAVPLAIVVVLAGAAFWWLVLRDDAPEELGLPTDTEDTSGADVGASPDTLDGTWSVQAGGDTTAGFRINESFASGLADHTAVGRSTEVTGSLDLEGTTATEGSFVVDLAALEFTDDPGISVANRARAMQNRGLETAAFPEATFALTAPVDFGDRPADGKTVSVEVTGDLTIHGVTKEVTFLVDAVLNGDTLSVATQDPVPVLLEDYSITKPTGGPIAEIDDEGSFEFVVVFTKS